MKKVYLLIILMSALLIAGCTKSDQTDQQSSDQANNNVIEITSSGFSPDTLTINIGETVTFVNKDIKLSWPASAIHPTHTVYPGSDIKKCGTSEETNIFDACKGLAQGESWSFTFNSKGTWNYHNHLNPSLRGKIIVQ